MGTHPVDALVTHRYVDVGELKLHVAEAGSGPLVILLHGFPDFWYSWRNQIPALVAAGYRVVAPDMRGYNLSDKPPFIADYQAHLLAQDVAGLLRACGEERAAVVGHDWGAGVAWTFATRYPEMLTRLAILNVPHPVPLMRGLRTLRQLCRSWYMFYFQIPGLPEVSFRAGNWAVLRRTLRTDPVNPLAVTEADIERYVEAAARPGALTAAINYYRAALRHPPTKESLKQIEAPTLVIWGDQDRYLGRELAEPPAEWVPNAQVVHLPQASHWVHMDQPELVNTLLLKHLQ